jgi:hypothetical protein
MGKESGDDGWENAICHIAKERLVLHQEGD